MAEPRARHHHHAHAPAIETGAVKDPVCGMRVDPRTARHAHHRGVDYFFCGPKCRERFEAEPARYLAPAPPPATAADAAAAIWTCPMHPEIRQARPGACPICGMALEPASFAEEAGNPELADMTRRFAIGVVLAVPVVLLDMGGAFVARSLSPLLSQWLQLLLASPIVLWAGGPFFQRGLRSVRNRALNMFSLISLGVGAAYLYSLVATVLPGLYPADLRPDGVVPVYFEAAAVITVLALLGQVLELRARSTAGSAIRALLQLVPETARRIRPDGTDEDVALDKVEPGDRLRLRPGDRVPVDGIVLDGRSALDQSLVTGESMPVEKTPGAAVIAGTINGTGSLVLRAEKVGSGTMLARIVRMVAEAQRSRAPIQRLADGVASWFVPAVIAVAALAFAAWTGWGPPPALGHALVAAVSVVIIACPCALGLATPMAITVGIGKGAAAGVLIRNAEAVERFATVDTLVVDKTGTLTEGTPRVVAVTAADGFDEATLLPLAAGAERSSEHPLGAAVVAAAKARGVPLQDVAEFCSVPGEGVIGRVGGRPVAVGSARLLETIGIASEALEADAEMHRRAGATAVFVAVDGRLAGLIAIADPVKATTRSALASLRNEGVRIVMLTGDNRTTADAVARGLGIAEVEAEILPDGKSAVIRRLRREGRSVAMAGDGVNDAPALAAADVGVAMGDGTDVAIASAGVTLVKGDLAGIVRARALSRATMRTIRQNLALAFVYNALGVPLAAGVLYPAFGLLPSPIVAAAAMSVSSVSVIANSLRLRAAAQ